MEKIAERASRSGGRAEAPSGVLARYAVLLEAVAGAPAPPVLSAIAERTGLPPGTVHRLLNALVRTGFLARIDDRKAYRLGPRLVHLLYVGMDREQVATLARPLLEALAERFGETAFVAKRAGEGVEAVATATPVGDGQAYVQPGRVMPFHAAASAKAILAFQGEAAIAAALARPRAAFTARTRTDPGAIAAELAEVRASGVAVCDEELDPGVLSYACPVHLDGAGVLYSVGLVGLAERLRGRHRAAVVAALKEAAAGLAARLPRPGRA